MLHTGVCKTLGCKLCVVVGQMVQFLHPAPFAPVAQLQEDDFFVVGLMSTPLV